MLAESFNQLGAHYYLFVEETFDFGGTLAYALSILKIMQIHMNQMETWLLPIPTNLYAKHQQLKPLDGAAS